MPVLVVRPHNAESPARRRARRVGVLRQPFLPDARARSVSAVLGMRQS
jgi:hypothetical protein